MIFKIIAVLIILGLLVLSYPLWADSFDKTMRETNSKISGYLINYSENVYLNNGGNNSCENCSS